MHTRTQNQPQSKLNLVVCPSKKYEMIQGKVPNSLSKEWEITVLLYDK